MIPARELLMTEQFVTFTENCRLCTAVMCNDMQLQKASSFNGTGTTPTV